MPIRDDRLSNSGPLTRFGATAVLDHGSVGAATTVAATVTVAGLLTSDLVDVNPGAALPAGIVIAAVRASAANTLEITLGNVTAGAIDPPAITYSVGVYR